MKFRAITILSALLFVGCDSQKNDSVKQAQEQNVNAAIDEKISIFLTEAADARLAAIEEGKLAKEKGTAPTVKQYGEWMVVENTKILRELRMLAASKNIVLPTAMSNENAEELDDLKEEQGEDFDEAFLKRMRKDHKEDVDDFEDAEEFKDKDVKKFASTYRPVIASHLERVEKIHETAESADDDDARHE